MGWVKRNFDEKSPIIFPKNSRLYKIYALSELYYTRFSQIFDIIWNLILSPFR